MYPQSINQPLCILYIYHQLHVVGFTWTYLVHLATTYIVSDAICLSSRHGRQSFSAHISTYTRTAADLLITIHHWPKPCAATHPRASSFTYTYLSRQQYGGEEGHYVCTASHLASSLSASGRII